MTLWRPPTHPDVIYHSAINPIKPISGIGNRVREWKNHKYLKKIGNRYFYTQEQLSAYMRGGQKAIGNAANRARSAAGNVANRALNSRNGRAINNAFNSARRAASNRLGQAGKSIYDAAGGSAKRNLAYAKQSEKALRSVYRKSGRKNLNAWSHASKARVNREVAQIKYNKSLLGRAEKASNQMRRLGRTAANQAKQAGYRAGHAAHRLVSSVKPQKTTRYVSSYARREANGRRQDRVRKNLDAARNSATNAARSLAKAPASVRRNVNANSRINSAANRQYNRAKSAAKRQYNRATKAANNTFNRAVDAIDRHAVNKLRSMYGRTTSTYDRLTSSNAAEYGLKRAKRKYNEYKTKRKIRNVVRNLRR